MSQAFFHVSLNGRSKTINSRYSRSDKIRIFCKESRNYQNYGKNLVNCTTVNISANSQALIHIRQFMFDTFSNQVNHLNTHLNERKYREMKELSEVLFEKNKKCKYVKLQVIWVFCYEFETEQILAYPIIKINQNGANDSVQFFDWKKKEYSSWEKFLDGSNDFPLGVICVPTHGSYELSPNSNLLCLEFFSTAPNRENLLNSSLCFSRPNICKINNWINKIYLRICDLSHEAVTFCKKIWVQIKIHKNLIIRVTTMLISIACMTYLPDFIGITGGILGVIDFFSSFLIDKDNVFMQCLASLKDNFGNIQNCASELFGKVGNENNMLNFPALVGVMLKMWSNPNINISNEKMSIEQNAPKSINSESFSNKCAECQKKPTAGNIVEQMSEDLKRFQDDESINVQNVNNQLKSREENVITLKNEENASHTVYLFQSNNINNVWMELYEIVQCEAKIKHINNYFYTVTDKNFVSLGTIRVSGECVMGYFLKKI